MKILEITYNLRSGGAERFVVDLSNQLSNSNDITLFAIKDDEPEGSPFYKKDLNAKVLYKSIYVSFYNIYTFFKLYQFIKKESAEVVHFNGENIIFFFILPILFYRKCKYFETQHNDATFIKNPFFRFLYKVIYKSGLVKTAAISKYNLQTIKKTFALKEIELIVNGRDRTVVSDRVSIVESEINSYKNDPSTLCFLHIARCAKQKNQELLIKAFNKFSQQNNAILLIIGVWLKSELGNQLKAMADKNIYFLGEKSNIADYLHCSDAFCLSSIYEGMPITLIEAFSQSCIPISTPVSGSIDYIIDGKTGFLSSGFEEKDYLATLDRFVMNYKTINKDDLLQLYKDNFSMEECAKKYLNWFNK